MRYKLPLWESSLKLAPNLRSMVQQGTLLAGGRCGLICDSWPPFEHARRIPKLVLWCHQDNKTTILGVESFYYYYHHYYYYYYFNQGLPNKFSSQLSSQRLTLMKLINSCMGQSKLYTSSFGSMIKLDTMSNLIKAGLLT